MPVPVGSDYPASIITLDDVDAEVNGFTAGGLNTDEEMQGFINAATAVIEAIAGKVVPAVVTDAFVTDTTNPWPYHYGTWPRYTYGVRSVVLRQQPVLSVTSVAVSSMDGTNSYTLAAGSYRFDAVSGMVSVIDSSAFGPLVTVTYTAGRATVPANVRLAALELVRIQFRPQQSGSWPGTSGGPGDDFAGTSVMGFFVPNRVLELLGPSRQAPVVA